MNTLSDIQEACTGIANGCACDDCGHAWRTLWAEWQHEEQEELPYAN